MFRSLLHRGNNVYFRLAESLSDCVIICIISLSATGNFRGSKPVWTFRRTVILAVRPKMRTVLSKALVPYSFLTRIVPPYVTIIINHSSPSPPCGLFDNNIIWVCDYGRGDKAHRCGNNVTTYLFVVWTCGGEE